jgi:hypothetical protein
MADWQVWNRQELFLAAYSKIGKAAEAAEIPLATVESWQRRDTHGFKKRMKLALDRCVEEWEEVMDERLLNPTGNRGSDVLLMFKLKAMAPEKYREEVKVLGVSAPLQMLDKLKELAAKDLKGRELEAPVVEGEFREVAPANVSKSERGGGAPLGMPSAEMTPRHQMEPPKKPVKSPVRKMNRR